MLNKPEKENHEVLINELKKELDNLKSSSENLEPYLQLFENSPELMCITTLNGFFKKVNSSFSTVLGYSSDEFINRSILDFVHPDDKEKSLIDLNSYLSGNSNSIFENRFLTKSGEIKYLQWLGYVDTSNNVIYAQARDVSQLKADLEELDSNKGVYIAAQKILKLGNWSYTISTNKVNWSKEVYEIFEVDPSTSTLFEDYLSRFIEPEKQELFSHLHLSQTEGLPYTFHHSVNFPDGRSKWVYCSGIPVKDDAGKIIRIEGVIQDVSAEKIAQEKLLRSEKLLNAAQAMAKLGSWSFDLKTQESYWSDELYNIYEINPKTVKNLFEEFMALHSKEDREILEGKIYRAIQFKESYSVEHQVKLPSGKEKWVIGTGIPVVDSKGEVIKLEGVVQDISEIKKSQEIILNNIKEKETLIKELHHRVKNNMQLISSMLNLQLNYFNDDRLRSAIRDSQQRIKSMSTVHDLLYRTGNLTQINFERYIKELIGELVSSYQNPTIKIDVEFKITPAYFPLDVAVPLGLLINEIITNSLKHAFSPGSSGKILFSLKEHGNQTYEIDIADNGNGVKVNKSEQQTLGTMLIENLAGQLDGKLDFDSNHNGTSYKLTFSTRYN